MKVNPNLSEDIDHILDVFGGGDNVTFMAFKMLVEHLDDKKDDDSKRLLDVITKFARLLRASRAMLEHSHAAKAKAKEKK